MPDPEENPKLPAEESAQPLPPAEAVGDQAEAAQAESAEETTTEEPADKVAPHPKESAATIPLEERQQAQALGKGISLVLAIGAAGLMLMLLFPWAQVYYLNPLQPLQFAADGAIQFTRDEVVHVSLHGFQLLTFHLWPLLVLFIAASLLFGTAIYWRQTHILQQRTALILLGLGLLVGVVFPVELTVLVSRNQQVDWSNSHATIEANHNVHDFSAKDGKLYLCTPLGRLDPTCNNDYSNGIIVNAGVDWVEINGATGQPLIQGHAQATRASSTSRDVTTSGYAIGSLGLMNPGFGYWGAWFFALWTLFCALVFANRLRKSLRMQPGK